MIEILNQSTDSCLVAHISGKPTGDEYQQFLDALETRLEKVGEVNLVVDLTGFEFYGDFEAFKKDLKFGAGEYKKVRRAAFVGRQKWLDVFTRLIGPFTQAEEKHFTEDQLQAACAWAGA